VKGDGNDGNDGNDGKETLDKKRPS